MVNWGISHSTLSPNNPQPNSIREKPVQTAKRLLMQEDESKNDPYLVLLEH
jgi:hypothetical protein